MSTHFIVRYGRAYPNVQGACGLYASESDAERTAFTILGYEMNEEDSINYTQVIKVTDGREELVNEFEN